MKASYRFLPMFFVFLLIAGAALGQSTTGSLNGTVTHEGTPLPGATVTISSPQLQGQRVAVTNVNGDFNFSALPPGQYTVVFEMEGMATVTQTARVNLARSERINVELQLSSIAEQITVTAAAPAILETSEVQTTVDHDTLEELPIGRTVLAAVSLAPGTNTNSPRGATSINGATAFDSLYLINGAFAGENVRGAPQNIFIEDAIQETTTLTANISAEYGRFTGGVVTAITKSGGNDFSGSFRDSFTNDAWTKPSDFGEDKATSKLNETYEMTLGGRILRDRLWFFAAGRYFENAQEQQLRFTTLNYDYVRTDKRMEGKLTGQITPRHSLVASYLDNPVEDQNNCQLGCLDYASLIPAPKFPQTSSNVSYNGILTSNFLLEGTWSTRELRFEDLGSTDLSYPTGTPGIDYSGFRLNGNYNAPYFGGSTPRIRENEYYNIKSTYYWATPTLGTHDLRIGYDLLDESINENNYQSANDFTVWTHNSRIVQENGRATVSILNSNDSEYGLGDWIFWFPVLNPSIGSHFKSSAIYFNDKWTLNSKWSFNIGLRYDKNDGTDQAGNKVADDSYVSPRISTTYDVKGDGRFRISASYADYTSRIAENIGGAASANGSPASFIFLYEGPSIINQDSNDAFGQVFDWFFANGGTSNSDILYYVFIPGATASIDGSLDSPAMTEYALGFGAQVGQKGFVRFDWLNREWSNFYVTSNSPNDYAYDVDGNPIADLALVGNTDSFTREYDAFIIQGAYRFTDRLNLGGNYTWSQLKGNVIGENVGSGPISEGLVYSEYTSFAQNRPIGYLASDQEHKARLWLAYDQPLGAFGNLNFSVLQNYDSGTPYSEVAAIPIRAYVDNPGYLRPPSTATYYFSERGQYRWDDATSTDLAVNYEIPISRVSIFAQAELLNAFNEQAQIAGQTQIRLLEPFDPFTETPVEGVNWERASTFGAPSSAASYQLARTYRFSVGIRF